VSTMASAAYGKLIRGLRQITAHTVDEEPKWRAPGNKLLTGYKGEWR
jgi:hydrogenase small subunit